MLPVAIFRFSPTEGPAYFAQWLDAQGIAWELVALDEDARVPRDPKDFAGIGMMGGPMSVNDGLPWMEPLFSLLREAVDAKVPVIGHCLGGQLFSRALGGTIARTPTPEIGWVDVRIPDPGIAAEWFGGRERFTTFQWHYDVFTLPKGARLALTNAYNPMQGYVLDDRHIGFQCHIEMTTDLVDVWCRSGGEELPPSSAGPLQSESQIRSEAPQRVEDLHATAGDVYRRWARGLRSDR